MFDLLKSVGRHFAIYGLGNIVNRILGFLLIPFYTHYLTTSDYGTLELVELTGYIAGMFLAVGISNAVLRFYYDSEEPDHRRLVVSTAHVSVYALAMLFGGWLVLFSPGVSQLVFSSTDQSNLFRLAFTTLILAVGSEVPLNYLRAREQSMFFSLISVAKLLLGLGLNIYFLVGLGWSVQGILLSALITQVVINLVLSIYTFKHTGIAISWPLLKQMAAYGLPYIPGGVSVFVLHFSDRFFLERYTSLSTLGVYSLGYKFGMTLSPLLTEPFLSIWRPKMFELAKRPGAAEIYSNMFTYFCFVGITMALGMSILIQDLITIISPPEFHGASVIVPVIALAYVVWGAYFLIQVGILIAKETRHVAYIGVAAAALKLALNYALIPSFGTWGAAWATLASTASLVALGHWISNRYLVVSYQWWRLTKMVAVAGLLYWASLLIHLDSLWLSITVKLVLSLSFPLVLWAVRFYSPDEWRKIREILAMGVARVRRK